MQERYLPDCSMGSVVSDDSTAGTATAHTTATTQMTKSVFCSLRPPVGARISDVRTDITEVVDHAGLAPKWREKLKLSLKVLEEIEGDLAQQEAALLAKKRPTVSRMLEVEEDTQDSDSEFEDDCAPTIRSQEVLTWIRRSYTEKSGSIRQDLQMLKRISENDVEEHQESSISERVTLMRRSPSLAALLVKVGRLDLDVIAISSQAEVHGQVATVLFALVDQQQKLCSCLPKAMFSGGHTSGDFQRKLHRYMTRVDEAYEKVPYHSNMHAADVMMVMQWFCNTDYMRKIMDEIDHIMALVAGSVHDVGHDGMGNLFHIKTRSDLALRYNDRSVLENMHAAKAFELMHSHPDSDWFGLLSSAFKSEDAEVLDLQSYIRKGLLEMVLMTDTTKHDQLITKMQDSMLFRSAQGIGTFESGTVPISSKRSDFLDEKLLIMEVCLHAADISSPTKPQHIMLEWSRRILQEFWAQGDKEKSLGIAVSPLCDREKKHESLAAGQNGFIMFVVLPLFREVSKMMPEASEAIQRLESNAKYWQKMKEEEATYEEIFGMPEIMSG